MGEESLKQPAKKPAICLSPVISQKLCRDMEYILPEMH